VARVASVVRDDASRERRQRAAAVVAVEEVVFVVRVRHEEVEVAVLVEVGPGAVLGVGAGRHGDSRQDALVVAAAEVLEERVVLAVPAHDEQVVVAVVVPVAPRAAVSAETVQGEGAREILHERPGVVPVDDVVLAEGSAPRDVEIEVAVVVEVDPARGPVASGARDRGDAGDLREGLRECGVRGQAQGQDAEKGQGRGSEHDGATSGWGGRPLCGILAP
jgi:hypothetical protein